MMIVMTKRDKVRAKDPMMLEVLPEEVFGGDGSNRSNDLSSDSIDMEEDANSDGSDGEGPEDLD